MAEIKPKRRWFRFSLRTLFVMVTVVCALSGWYVNRLRIIELEREKLAGRWQVTVEPENPGPILDMEMDKQDVGVPSNGIGQIDFHMKLATTLPDGTKTNLSRAIYRWINDDEFQIAQAEPGKPRPTNFEKLDPKTTVYTGKRIANRNRE
jgi:hypothetical protein